MSSPGLGTGRLAGGGENGRRGAEGRAFQSVDPAWRRFTGRALDGGLFWRRPRGAPRALSVVFRMRRHYFGQGSPGARRKRCRRAERAPARRSSYGVRSPVRARACSTSNRARIRGPRGCSIILNPCLTAVRKSYILPRMRPRKEGRRDRSRAEPRRPMAGGGRSNS